MAAPALTVLEQSLRARSRPRSEREIRVNPLEVAESAECQPVPLYLVAAAGTCETGLGQTQPGCRAVEGCSRRLCRKQQAAACIPDLLIAPDLAAAVSRLLDEDMA